MACGADAMRSTRLDSIHTNRTLGLLRKSLDSSLPCSAEAAAPAGSGHPLRQACEEQVAAAAAAYERMAPHAAVEALLGIAAAANLYVDQQAPWTALKKGGDGEEEAAGRVLVAVLEAGRVLAVALSPITPALSSRMYQQLGLGGEPLQGRVTWADTAWGQLQRGHTTAAPQPVFARLDETTPFVTEPAAAAAGGGGGGKGAAAAAAKPAAAKAR
jgi:methionyl-tRNA synthetase